MEVVSNAYMPSDPRLVEQLVYELKSQGIFDQFRKECIADVDTKPAYQNLRQRVEGSVTSFLGQQTWRPDMNKNQVREQLRKNIFESGYLETGVERIVDQVVNPKINTIFLPQVEDVVYRYLGIEKPNRSEIKKELKIDVTDLLPTDLEAISPESDHTKDDSFNFNDSVNSETKMEEDESPPFEPIDVQNSNIQLEENSVDSHLSGFSGLQSHDSNLCPESKIGQMELSNQDSQVSQNSSESRLSIITSEDNTKMDIREDSNSKLTKTSDSCSQIEPPPKEETTEHSPIQKDEESKPVSEVELNITCNVVEEKNLKPLENEKPVEKVEEVIKTKQSEEKPNEDKKYDKKNDEKKRSSDKYSSKDKRDEKYRKSSTSSSSNRDKEKSSSKYSSSSSKDKYKDKKESRSSSTNSNNKDKNEKDDSKYDKEKIKNDKEKDKDKREKENYEKDKMEKSKSSKDKDKGRSSSGSTGSSSINKYSSGKEKEKSSSTIKPDSSKRDKEKSSSSSSSKENKSKSTDSKSKSSDKYRKGDKSTHSIKYSSSSSSSSSSKRDKDNKDKKRESKKDIKDDHYSSKYKKSDRRSTDRDSNDGRSSKQSQMNSLADNNSSQPQKSNQESSSSNSGSGSGDSGTSDQTEQVVKSPAKIFEQSESTEVSTSSLAVDALKFKYIKPKFASNFQEARKLMKIRKQLAKLERQNQLSLAEIEVSGAEIPMVNGVSSSEKECVETEEQHREQINHIKIVEEVKDVPKIETVELSQYKMSPKDDTLLLPSKELSKENWEALEARLAQEMSNINYDSYESPYDDDFGECNLTESKPHSSVSENCVVVVKVPESVHCEPEKVQEKETEQLQNPEMQNEVRNVPEETEKIDACDNTLLSKDSHEESDESVRKSLEQSNDDTKEVTSNNDQPEITSKAKTGKLKVDVQVAVDDNNKVGEKVDNMESDSDTCAPCAYLDPPSPGFNKKLQFLNNYIKTLELEVEHSVKTFQNNFVSTKQRLGKRKLTDNVDVKNNNKDHYEQTTEGKKRRRPLLPNPNSVISKANKEKLCNSSDIAPNDSFSLPLSPAESDKSNDKKDEDSPKAKHKRESIARTIHTRSQRYSSEDLYKPRPIFMGSRRSRGAKNVEK